MKKQLLIGSFGLIFVSSIFYSCTKDVGANPLLDKNAAYTDKALFDSCKNQAAFSYYQNGAVIISDPINGSPHGNFKLKFNKIATAALGTDGELAAGNVFPEGSMVVKETVAGKFNFLFKRSGSWLWGEVTQDGSNVIQSVNSDPALCISCHHAPGFDRDFVLSFSIY